MRGALADTIPASDPKHQYFSRKDAKKKIQFSFATMGYNFAIFVPLRLCKSRSFGMDTYFGNSEKFRVSLANQHLGAHNHEKEGKHALQPRDRHAMGEPGPKRRQHHAAHHNAGESRPIDIPACPRGQALV